MIYTQYEEKLAAVALEFKPCSRTELLIDYEENFVGTLKQHKARLDEINHGQEHEAEKAKLRAEAELAIVKEFSEKLQAHYGLSGRNVNHRAALTISTKENPNDFEQIERNYKLLSEFIAYQASSSYR